MIVSKWPFYAICFWFGLTSGYGLADVKYWVGLMPIAILALYACSRPCGSDNREYY